jgi:endonuclease YncB( thermonuclease family)
MTRTQLVARFIAAMVIVLGAGWLYAIPARAEDTLRGNANIVDGDTIDIAGIPIRLEGIDAPEQQQSCTGDNTSTVPCGELATKALARLIGGAPVTCVLLGRDGYDRLLGDCSTEGPSLNAQMVRSGWALAFVKYSQRYVSAEDEARTARAGLWQWQFDKPWDWRAGVLQQAVGSSESLDGCVIKGNISGSGDRIYHMPFHQHYGRSRIDERTGERWFCTEDEAQKAGWRRALR